MDGFLHSSRGATTVFEALEDAGLVMAINFTCYRGRTRHAIRLPEVMRRNRWFEAVDGLTRFFFFNLFESDPTGVPACDSLAHPRLHRLVRGGRRPVAGDARRLRLPRLLPPRLRLRVARCRPQAALDALEHADAALAEPFARPEASRTSRALRDRRLLRSRPDSGRAWREAWKLAGAGRRRSGRRRRRIAPG